MKRVLVFAFITMVTMTACAARDISPVPIETLETASIRENVDAAAFSDSASSRYSLDTGDGIQRDVSDYVIGCEGTAAVFDSRILEDVFGFFRYDRPETDENPEGPQFIEYLDNDKNLFQLEKGGKTAFYNGKEFRATSDMIPLDGSDSICLPVNLLTALGYTRIDTTRDGNSLLIELFGKEPDEEGEVTEE